MLDHWFQFRTSTMIMHKYKYSTAKTWVIFTLYNVFHLPRPVAMVCP
jgi:hypothetical protein